MITSIVFFAIIYLADGSQGVGSFPTREACEQAVNGAKDSAAVYSECVEMKLYTNPKHAG